MAESTLKQQGFFHALESLEQNFKGYDQVDPFDNNNFRKIYLDDARRDDYMSMTLESVNNDTERELFEGIIDRTVKGMVGGTNVLGLKTKQSEDSEFFSLEGYGHAGPNSGGSHLPALAPMTVLGYFARAYAMQLFHILKHDKKVYRQKFDLDYTYLGDDVDNRKLIEIAIADGTLNDMDAVDIIPEVDVSTPGNTPHYFKKNDNPANKESFIKLNASGNLLTDSGREIQKSAIDRALTVNYIAYDATHDGSANRADWTYSKFTVEKEPRSVGDVREVQIIKDVTLLIAPGDPANERTEIASFILRINLDTGDWVSYLSGSDRLKGISLRAKEVNIANEHPTRQVGRHEIHNMFEVERRQYFGMTEVPETIEDFEETSSVGYAAYMIDKMTTTYAGIRDNVLLKKLDDDNELPLDQFPMYLKVGGWSEELEFDLAQRGPGGEDPFSWAHAGLTDRVAIALEDAESSIRHNDNLSREWVAIGMNKDIRRLYGHTVTETNDDNDGANAYVDNRYGFSIANKTGFTDRFGNRIKLIGSREPKFRNPNIGVRGVMKSNDMRQPTTIYFPYDFNVFQGRSPELPGRDAIMIRSRDTMQLSSNVQFRLKLINNDKNLYSKIAEYSANGSITP